jgi:hypothetical protein
MIIAGAGPLAPGALKTSSVGALTLVILRTPFVLFWLSGNAAPFPGIFPSGHSATMIPPVEVTDWPNAPHGSATIRQNAKNRLIIGL